MRNQRRVHRFIWKNEYLELGDPRLNRIVLGNKALAVLLIVLITGFAIAALLTI